MQNTFNFIQLTPDVATSGYLLEDDFKRISKGGYAAVINLAMPDHKRSLANEGKLVTEQGMSYVHIPVPFDKPSGEQIRLFCEIIKSFQGKKVWVHCIMNYRVSVFMYHYLTKVEGLSETQAMSPIFKYWEMDDVWQSVFALTSKEIGM